MKPGFSWERFEKLPVVGILRGFSSTELERIVEASIAGGLRNIEITMNSPGATEQIGIALAQAGDTMNVGAGTVRSVEDLDKALDAGAEFIVTPTLVPDVIKECRARQVPVAPGAFTPTEIWHAWDLGADLVKVFPADAVGPGYIRSVRAPLEDVRLMPTGGVTVETLGEYKRAGAAAFGVGSPLFSKSRVKARDWAWIEEQCRRFVDAFESS